MLLEQPNSQKLFKAADFFMLRTPLLPISLYKKKFENSIDDYEDFINTISNNSTILEAITIASLSLSKELDKRSYTSNKKKREQVLSSLIKYLIRMTTRTTPFGLFSGVTLGNFSDSTDISIEKPSSFSKRARPDMEWLYAIIKRIETNNDYLMDLSIKANDLNEINGSRVDISYISNYGQTYSDNSSDNMNASIRNTNQVKFVLEKTKSFIKYKELLAILITQNPNVPVNRIEGFLKQLLSNEYLLTELRPPLGNSNPFEHIIDILKNINTAKSLYEELLSIKNLINKYNSLSMGEGKSLYLDIINKMKNLEQTKNYLQVDMSIATKNATLTNEVPRELEKVSELMMRLSGVIPENDHLTNYIKDFIEEYGTNREIPLLELLDEDKGLGAPAGYKKPLSTREFEFTPDSNESKKIQSLFMSKIIEALKKNQKEVIIMDDDFNSINTIIHPEYIPDSFEIYASVTHKEDNHDDIDIFLGANYGSESAGKSFGRFVDIMPPQVYDSLNHSHIKEKNLLGENQVLVEIVELPQSGRASNVTLNWNPREYELVLATNCCEEKTQISINDLYVGVEHNSKKYQIYIKSKSLNKKLLFTANNMLNVQNCSNIYRFLYEISTMQKINPLRTIYYLYEATLKELNYHPRIKYSKVVIYPETWKLNREILKLDTLKCNFNEFLSAVNICRQDWNIPRYVYLKDGDHRLLLDLEVESHLNELLITIKKNEGKDIIITESQNSLENLVVKGENSLFFSEIVLPMFKNEKINSTMISKTQESAIQTTSNYESYKNALGSYSLNRIILPGDEWLYFKLYGNNKRIDEFISFELLPICQSFVTDGDVEKFFYIKYADPKSHVRLRLKIDKSNISNVLDKLNTWFKRLLGEGLISKVVIDTYIRELERYGGPELITYAEDVFYYDSIFTGLFLTQKRNAKLDNLVNIFMVSSIINIMEELKISYETQRKLLMQNYGKDSYRQLFNKNRKELLNICNSNNDWIGLRKVSGGNDIYNLFQLRKTSLNIFVDKLIELDDQKKLWNNKINIIFSIIHMHCNRLNVSNEYERYLMSLTRHTLQSLEYTKKQNSNKII